MEKLSLLGLKIMHLLAQKTTKVIVSLVSFFSPVSFVFFLIGFAIIADTFAGRWAAKKVAEREGKDVRLFVTSKRTREGLLTKMITYQCAIIGLYIMDYYVLNSLVKYILPNFPINYIITILVGLILVWVEWDSIDEKYYIVTGKRLNDSIKNKVKQSKVIVKDLANFKSQFSDKSKPDKND